MEIYQGDSFDLKISLSIDENNFLKPELLEDLEINLGVLTKKLSQNSIQFDNEDSTFIFPLSQRESFLLSPGRYLVQVRAKFADTGEVYGMEFTEPIIIRSLNSKEVL